MAFRRDKIYRVVKARDFPPPIKLGRMSVWLRSEINDWMSEKIDAARA
ncbi:helix-turn-helix transcriptional regulator [Novosphingobium sp.]